MIKLLGLFDFLAALFLVLAHYGIASNLWLAAAGFYLIIKGGFFITMSRDFASIADVVLGLIFVFGTSLQFPGFLVLVLTLWLLQKAVFSFI